MTRRDFVRWLGATGVLAWLGGSVWRNPVLHWQYEAELAEWWEMNRPIIGPIVSYGNFLAYWPMIQADDGRWLDISGNGRHLTSNGSPVFGNDPMTYVELDGSSYLSRADEPAWPTGSFTAGLWARPSDIGLAGDLMAHYSAASPSFFLRQGGADAVARIDGPTGWTTTSSSSVFSSGTWLHFVYRYDAVAGTVARWINGQRGVGITSQASILDSADPLTIGARGASPSQYFTGRIGHAWIAAEAMTDRDIEHVYKRQSAYFGL